MSANIPNNPVAIQKFFTSRDNNANSATYVGQEQRLWYDPITNAIYVSDGNTAGGILVGGTGSGNGVAGGPTNSIQYNAGSGTFGGTSNVVVSGTGMVVSGNVVASYFVGNVSTTGNITGGNILTNNYLYANGNSIFANVAFTGNINLGNLYIIDETIYGKNINANINITPEGSGVVNVPSLGISPVGTFLRPYPSVGGANPGIELLTVAGYDLTFSPGAAANILTAGNIMPTGNNIAALGQPDHRYTGLWLGSGNINFIDQGLGIDQQLYALNGNVIFGNSTGIKFGQFEMFGTTISTTNPAANIKIGLLSSSGYVEIDRPLTVNSTGGAGIAFQVERSGQTQINAPGLAVGNSAFNIVATTSGNTYPISAPLGGSLIHATSAEGTPAFVTLDSFSNTAAAGGYVVSRRFRGTVAAPLALQAGDTMALFGAGGYNGSNIRSGVSSARITFKAAENFTANSQSANTEFRNQVIGTGADAVSAIINATGLILPSAGQGGTGNVGITFQDGSFQNTAFLPTNVVTSLAPGAGISLSNTVGNITVTNVGVTSVSGTGNQIYVNGAGNIAAANGAVVLSLPQDISQNSNPTFNNLTVNNLSIIGNVSNVIPAVVNGPIVFVANTATALSDLNNSGLISGNISNSAYAGMLFQTSGSYPNTWDFTIGNGRGIVTNEMVAGYGNITGNLHVGAQYQNPAVDYVNALIQADWDGQNTYVQYVIQNHYQGDSASADYVAVNNIGDDGNNYIDMGINSNVYSNAAYAATQANDGYLYVNGGNLIIGTQTPAKTITFITGGTNSATAYNRVKINDIGMSVIGNVTANNFIGNTVAATTVTGTTVSASSNVIGQNVSAVGIVSGASVVGTTVSATANVVAGNVRTTGQISTSGNVVANIVVTGTTVIDGGVSTAGNVTAANVVAGGTISALGNISTPNLNASIAIVSTLLSISGNITGGNLITGGLISTTGNATFGNVGSAGAFSATGNVDAGNLRTGGIVVGTAVSATGNVTGTYILGNGSQLTSITGANVTGTVANATYAVSAGTATSATTAATVTTAAQPNITSVGILSSVSVSGNAIVGNIAATNHTGTAVSVTGNVTGNYILGNGSQLTSITGANVTGTVANATYAVNSNAATYAGTVTTAAQPNITSVGILSSVSVSGNITGGNIAATNHTGTTVSVTGNITGNYILGNGSQLTGIATSNSFSNVYANGTAVLATSGSSVLTVTPGNNQVITGNNTSKTLTIAVNDNPTFGNVSVIGNITVSGNILTANTTYLANVGNILFSNVAPLPAAQPGVMEYDGRVLYFTPQDQERGVIPAQQWYVLNSDRNLTFAATTPQSLFGVGVHVSNSTRYHFRIKATISRNAGTNNTALTLGWRGTATMARISYTVISALGAAATPATTYLYETTLVANFTNQITVTSINSPPDSADIVITGIIDVGAAGVGYVDPYISWTGAAAAGSVTVSALSNFEMYPVGVTGANTQVGNWA